MTIMGLVARRRLASRIDAADSESRSWLLALRGSGAEFETASAGLYTLLLRVAHAELTRRRASHSLVGTELDDTAHTIAADACVSILAKLDDFRGESRFTTWAIKFAIFEVSTKLAQRAALSYHRSWDSDDWSELPGRIGLQPERVAEASELVAALTAAIQTELTELQRRLIVEVVINQVPLDVLTIELGATRNALYKGIFDARRKLRASLVASGFLEHGRGDDVQ